MNSEINKVIRVLETGSTRLKYTIRVNKPDGTAIEWQSDQVCNVCWNESLREPWLFDTGIYHNSAIMKWPEGAILICERNKDVKD